MEPQIRYAYVGCRTTRERNARGDGLSVYSVPSDGGPWIREQLLTGLINPSYLCFDRKGVMLYAVHGDSSEATSFRIHPETGKVEQVNQVSTKGKNPVHIAIDPTNSFAVIANHITAGEYVSSLAVIALRPDGSFGEMTDHVTLSGKIGPHRVEQPFAKPHQCQFDPSGTVIAVPDKGLDRTVCYRLDRNGKLTAVAPPPAPSREGEGPRHVAFHPAGAFAYVLNELSSTITSCRFDPSSGGLQPFQVTSSLPDTFTGLSRASEIDISPDGRFVYASNRGFDSIGVFAVDATTGRLAPKAWAETGGKTPRFFALSPSGRHVFAANEDGDSIVRLDRDASEGGLDNPVKVADTGSPTCILFRTA